MLSIKHEVRHKGAQRIRRGRKKEEEGENRKEEKGINYLLLLE